MVSSINPFFALSYANIASLFGTAAASPSDVTATIAGSSLSSASISSTNDPAKAIQAILAQADVAKAPAAAASASGVSSTVESAYAAQTTAPAATASGQASSAASGPSSTDVETGANLDETKAQLTKTEAMFSSLFSADPSLPYTATAFVAQATTTDTATSASVQVGSGQASSTLTATASSARATSTIFMSSFNGGDSAAWPLVRGASLAVATTNGLSEVGVGNSNLTTKAADMAISALGIYRSDVLDDSQSNPNQQYLRMTIDDSYSDAHDDSVIESQAQTLLSAFENGQLASPSSRATGFTYNANTTNDCYSISAHEVDSTDLTYSIMAPTSSGGVQKNAAFSQLNAMSMATGTITTRSGTSTLTEWLIPIGNTARATAS